MRVWLLVSSLGTAAALAFACSSDPQGADGESSSSGSSGASSSGGSSGASSGASSGDPSATGTDGKKNGSETDVDCGGPDRPKCANDKTCGAGEDCESGVCKTTCQAPSATDAIKNGDETDVDCGGTSGNKCNAGQTCAAHADCASDGCDFAKKCAVARSCTAESGGQTCGEGDIMAAGKKHESCCKSIAVPGNAATGAYFLDKYLVTAGRMRTFIERTNGNPRAFVASLPEGGFIGWKRAWDNLVPDTLDGVNFMLGNGGTRNGCDLGASKARTYWMSDAVNQGLGDTGVHPANSQSTLDAKVLNCVNLMLVYALCAWDGARLPSAAEVLFAWQAGEGRTFPWGSQANDATRSSDNEVHNFPAGFPNNWVNVPEPGRYPAGYGKFGHADLVGTVFHFTRDVNGANTQWARVNSGSWETAHTIAPSTTQTNIGTAYWAYGGRCARPAAN